MEQALTRAVLDLRLRDEADLVRLPATGLPEMARGDTRDDQAATLTKLGLEVISEMVAPDEAWEHYHQTVTESAEAFALEHPEADYRDLAATWMEDFERDREYLTWTVWVARKH